MNDGDKEIVCVFQSENKLDEIESNPYLKKAYDKLESLTGYLIIIGSSLADNDNHIFEQIEKSDVEKIYISTREGSKDKYRKIAMEKFPTKAIQMFNADSISYNLPTDDEEE